MNNPDSPEGLAKHKAKQNEPAPAVELGPFDLERQVEAFVTGKHGFDDEGFFLRLKFEIQLPAWVWKMNSAWHARCTAES